MGALACFFSPLGCGSGSLAKATVGDLFSAFTAWLLESVSWFLTQAGAVLASAGDAAQLWRGAQSEYATMETLAPIVTLVALVVATMTLLRRGQSAGLWSLYFGVLPAVVLVIFTAPTLAQLVMTAVDQLSGAASQNVAAHTTDIATALLAAPSTTPGFGVFLLAVAVIAGTFLLWCELVVRTVALTFLLVMVPVLVPLTLVPALRRVGWRLLEVFLVVVVSKFVIVVVLNLGLSEMTSGSFTGVVTGAVSFLLATLAPLLLVGLLPLAESSAAQQLAGLRGRFTQGVQRMSTHPAVAAAGMLLPEPDIRDDDDRPAGWGVPMHAGEAGSEPDFTALANAEPLPYPVMPKKIRTGHVEIRSDKLGPVIGWEWDD